MREMSLMTPSLCEWNQFRILQLLIQIQKIKSAQNVWEKHAMQPYHKQGQRINFTYFYSVQI